MGKSWTCDTTHNLGDYKVFKLLQKSCRSPRTGQNHDFFVFDAADWVTIVPVTPEGKLVFIRQWRPGTESVELELPGGIIDNGELPKDAAVRELREETGYMAETLTPLGSIAPNPAIQTNRCHFFLAKHAVPTGHQELDSAEDIELALQEHAMIPTLIAEETLRHGIIIAALYSYDLYLKREQRSLKK